MKTRDMSVLFQIAPSPSVPAAPPEPARRLPPVTGGTRPLAELLGRFEAHRARLEAVSTDAEPTPIEVPIEAPIEAPIEDVRIDPDEAPRNERVAVDPDPTGFDEDFDEGYLYPAGCSVRRVPRAPAPELPVDPLFGISRSGALALGLALVAGVWFVSMVWDIAPKAPSTRARVPVTVLDASLSRGEVDASLSRGEVDTSLARGAVDASLARGAVYATTFNAPPRPILVLPSSPVREARRATTSRTASRATNPTRSSPPQPTQPARAATRCFERTASR